MPTELLVKAEDSLLLVVDLQQRLAPAISGRDAVEARVATLIRGARRVGVPVRASEQYPQGLGPTVPAIAALLDDVERLPKRAFSCAAEPDFLAALGGLGRSQVVICGMEAHVCVLQTALGLSAAGFSVFAVADAMGSRDPANREIALRRLAGAGVVPVTSEMVLFEWLGDCDNAAFKDLLGLIR